MNQQPQPQAKGFSPLMIAFLAVVVLGIAGTVIVRGVLEDILTPKRSTLHRLVDPAAKKFATRYYDDQEKKHIVDVHVLEAPEEKYRVNSSWALPASIQIGRDKTITFVEATSEYLKPQHVNLVQQGLPDGKVRRTVNLFDPELPRLAELPATHYIFTDREKGQLIFLDATTFQKETITLPLKISSSFWTPDRKTIFFTQEEDTNEGNANIYTYDVVSGKIQAVIHDDPDFLRYIFTPLGGGSVCGSFGLAQQYWRHGKKSYSPNDKLLALDDCKGILILNTETLRASHLLRNVEAFVLGWVNDHELIARVKNSDGDARIVRINTKTKEEKRLLPENFYWDIFWLLSPDRSKLVYAASSTSLENLRVGNEFASANAPLWEAADLYIVDLVTNTRKQILSAYTPAGNLQAQWSVDGRHLLISASPVSSSAEAKCDVYNVVAEKIQRTIKPCQEASWIVERHLDGL